MSSSAPSVKFLFVGRPTRTKGLPDLLAALPLLQRRGWTLTIAGDWSDNLPELIRFDTRCRILGAVAHARIPALMKDNDAVIVPSRYENFCNVALEAMAAGRAVLGSRCGGIPDLVEERVTGFLFEPGSVSTLRMKLQSALDAPEELSQMGANGWEKARNYSWQRIGRETDELLRELCVPSRSA